MGEGSAGTNERSGCRTSGRAKSARRCRRHRPDPNLSLKRTHHGAEDPRRHVNSANLGLRRCEKP